MNTKRFTVAALCILSLFFALSPPAHAQTALLNTTLSAAVDNSQKTITVAAATNITGVGNAISLSAIGAGSGNALWLVYADREAMEVVSVSSTTLTVRRGRQGTQASAHVSGQKVHAGPVQAFWVKDPIGPCTRTQLAYVPVINVLNGSINDCTNSSWSNFTTNPGIGAVLASTAGAMSGALAIVAKVTHISGTAAITGFDIPPGLYPGNSFTIIPDGAFTTTTAGNVSLASTGVANKALIYTWDGTKLSPNY